MMTMAKPNSAPATQGPIQWMPGYEVKARMNSEMGSILDLMSIQPDREGGKEDALTWRPAS